MTRVALRGLWGRKLRTALTAVAIVLGVALVAGTLVLTDSIQKAFDNIFTDSRQGSSVVISGKSAFDLSDDSGATAPPLNESLLQTVQSQPDVAEAEGSVSGDAQIIGDTVRRSKTGDRRTSASRSQMGTAASTRSRSSKDLGRRRAM